MLLYVPWYVTWPLLVISNEINTLQPSYSSVVYPDKMEYTKVKFYHFWPKNDGEKWSGKNIFEIPPCAQYVIFITEFVLLTKTTPFYQVNSFNRKW